MGLRELKKEQTRRLIADTAWRLFADHGFDEVTVTDVAREAQVAKATVFNYFPTKEDLFLGRLDEFGARIVDAVAARPAGETALSAFRRQLLGSAGLLGRVAAGDADALHRLRTVNRVIAASPALRARERESAAACAESLAALLASEAGASHADICRKAEANALVGVHTALVEYVRHRVLADDRLTELATDVRAQAGRALDLLEQGLGRDSPRPPADRNDADGA